MASARASISRTVLFRAIVIQSSDRLINQPLGCVAPDNDHAQALRYSPALQQAVTPMCRKFLERIVQLLSVPGANIFAVGIVIVDFSQK